MLFFLASLRMSRPVSSAATPLTEANCLVTPRAPSAVVARLLLHVPADLVTLPTVLALDDHPVNLAWVCRGRFCEARREVGSGECRRRCDEHCRDDRPKDEQLHARAAHGRHPFGRAQAAVNLHSEPFFPHVVRAAFLRLARRTVGALSTVGITLSGHGNARFDGASWVSLERGRP